ncbi:MAG: DinB family protein [Cyclobacteriaceae bacterium]
MNQKLKEAFDQVERRKEKLLIDLDKIDDDLINKKPAQNQWSILQVLKHVSDVERSSLNYCKKKIKAGDGIPNATIVDGIKMKLYTAGLLTSIKFRMPSNLSQPEENLNYTEVCSDWHNTRENLKKFASDYPNEFLNKAIYKNPLVGRTRLENMIKFFDAHLAHHEYQVARITKSFNN